MAPTSSSTSTPACPSSCTGVRHSVPKSTRPGLAALASALDRPLVQGSPDVVAPVAAVPEHGSGFPGRAGLRGHRSRGRAWSARFGPAGHELADGRIVVEAVDPVARLRLTTTFELGHALVVRVVITNDGDDRYMLDGLDVTLPLPECASDLLTFHGRHAREFQPDRRPWPSGAALAENWRGRYVARASIAAVRRHRRVRRVAGRGLGCAPGLERQPRDDRRATARRPADRSDGRAVPSRRGRPRTGRVVLDSRSRRGPFRRRPDAGHVGLPPSPPRPPGTPNDAASSAAQHVGGRVLRPRHRASVRAGDGRGRRRDRTVRARRRMVRVASRRHEGSRRLVGLARDVPRRAGAADQPRPVARDGVRHLGRARDGEPRQRPLPGPPRVGAHDRRLRTAARPQPARARPRPSRRVRARATNASTPCCATTTSRS